MFSHVMKFCSTVRNSVKFSGKERNFAELLLIMEAQVSLKNHNDFYMWEKQLSLSEDESEILRCRGRIDNANLPYSTKYPVILPGDHHLTMLYVLQAHDRVLHNGVKETLTELRSRFWVIRGRSVVKKILHDCYTCKRHEGKSSHIPPPPPLPAFRVEEAPSFTNTGVDFAGPLYVKQPEGNQMKVWIVLYTCCVTRAVHLDLVCDMSAPTFIRSFSALEEVYYLRQWQGLSGCPAKVIKEVVTNPGVQEYFDKLGIDWRFNIPKAPWWGGLFERLVKSTKRCLRKILGQAKLSHDEFRTALVEIEMVLNSRPLTYISSEDFDEPLTPSHLLTG